MAIALACILACGRGSESWIVQVDDHRVPAEELRRAIELHLQQDPDAPLEDLLNRELSRIVKERVVLNRAEQLGVKVKTREVEERLRELHGEGYERPDPEFLEEVRTEMLLQRTALVDLADRIRVQESSLVHHFEENRDRFRTPERVHIRQIVVEDAKRANQLIVELRGSADFSALASQHSLAPEAGEGGRVPPFGRGEMPEVFDRAFDLDAGELSGVLESPYGFHIFLLDERTPEIEPTLEDVRQQLRFELERKHLTELEKDWLLALRRVSEVRVNEELLETMR